MLIRAALAAWRQVLSRPFRRILLLSLALTAALLALAWFGITRLLGAYLQGHPLSVDYPFLDALAFILAGAGLFIALAYLLPAVSALVAGYFLDDAAEIVEHTDFPSDPPGEPLPVGRALLYGLRFAGLSLLVNLAALTLIFIPLVNVVAFFGANAYLLGREYFELAALRFRSPEEAGRMRVEFRPTVLLAGAMMAGLVLVPVLNLLTPLFGIALMTQVHKRLSARALPDRRRSRSLPRVEPGSRPR
jgi:CysZ protein